MISPPDSMSASDTPSSGEAEASAQAPQAAGAASGGAESGNTAPHTSMDRANGGHPEFQVLWQGLDTLELSYPGVIQGAVDRRLGTLKELAQGRLAKDQAQAQIQLGDRVFEVADRGGARVYAYLLRHPDMRIAVSSSRAKRIPLAVVTFQNEFLVSAGPKEAEAQARACLSLIGDLEGGETVSRCDLAADICTPQDIGAWAENAWVTRAEDIHRHTVNGTFTGWSIGLGADLSARLYDKRLEVTTKSKKYYFMELWLAAGWYYLDAVVRLEFQFRRAALAKFELKSLSQVLAARPALWEYACRDWTRLAIANPGDETKARWPLHPLWEQIQGIQWQGVLSPLARKVVSSGAPSDKALARMFKAVATSVMARDGLSTLDAAADRLKSVLIAELQRIEQWEGASALDLLMETVMLKQRKYCSRLNNP